MLRRKSLIFSIVVLTTLTVLMLASCAASTPPTPPEGTLTIALSSLGAEQWLPDRGADDKQFWDVVYEYLIYVDHDTAERIPGLAERWEMSADGLVWTFYLREGVTWQDGWGELTAEDVKYTLENIIMAEGSANTCLPALKEGIESIEVVDPYTIIFYLNVPDVFFPDILTINEYTPILCKKYVEEVGADEARLHPIGSGPYKLVEYIPGVSINLEAVDEHWRVVPEFKYLVFRLVPEQASRLAMLKTGDVDIADILTEQMDEVEDAGLKIQIFPDRLGHAVYFGGMIPPADQRYDPGYHGQDPWMDPMVREAMNIAINREEICQQLFYGLASPRPCPAEMPGWEDLEAYPYDPERARRLLADAGYPDGFELEYWSPNMPGYPSQLVDEAVVMYWENIGITVTIKLAESIFVIAPDFFAGKTAGVVLPMRMGNVENWTLEIAKIYAVDGRFGYAQDELINTWYHNEILGELDIEKIEAAYAKVVQREYDIYLSIPVVSVDSPYGLSQKVGDWPQIERAGGRVSYLEYITHAVPLNNFRLAECEP